MLKKELLSLKTIWYLAFAALFAFVVPIIFVTLQIDDTIKIGCILFGINVFYSVIVGLYAGKQQHMWIFLLLFPIVYFIAYRYFFDGYARYFALVYLCLTYLSYGITKD
jgi:hypothetical protein